MYREVDKTLSELEASYNSKVEKTFDSAIEELCLSFSKKFGKHKLDVTVEFGDVYLSVDNKIVYLQKLRYEESTDGITIQRPEPMKYEYIHRKKAYRYVKAFPLFIEFYHLCVKHPGITNCQFTYQPQQNTKDESE